MKVNLHDKARKKNVIGIISKALKKEMPKANSNWKFDWKALHSKNSLIFKLSYADELQGLLKMVKVDEGYYEMSNLELSPENHGSDGKFNNVAGCLIAFGCLLTFKLNSGSYKG